MNSQITGLNLIGPVSSNLGIGHSLRRFALALLDKGHPVSIFDVDPGNGRKGFDLSLQRYFAPRMEDLPHDINVWALGAFDLPADALQICFDAKLRSRFNAAMVWWELPHLPARLAVGASAFDALLAGSQYIHACLSNQVPGVPTVLANQPLDIPPRVQPDRARFGLPDSKLLVMTAFEPHSDPARKNALGAIEAFRRAFHGRPDVALVVKLNNANVKAAPEVERLLARFYELVAGDPQVHLITDRLDNAALLSLVASCDILLSLHRAEGLGMVPLEAMRLGKAVVATGWSGNMSYMNHRNAALVRYRFVPIDETASLYAPSRLGMQSYWAEPDTAHAVNLLRALADDGELRATLGARAQRDSEAYDAEARSTPFVEELGALYAQRSLAPPPDAARLRRTVLRAKREQDLVRAGPMKKSVTRLRLAASDAFARHLGWRLAR